MNNLKNWDSIGELAKAEFMDKLYKESGRTSGLYTGLYQRHMKWYRRLWRFINRQNQAA